MKVKEMRELVSSLQKEGALEGKTVEFVVDTKKYFAEDIKAGVDTMAFALTRNDFHPLTISGLNTALEMARGDLDIEVIVGKNKKVITSTYCGKTSFELVVE